MRQNLRVVAVALLCVLVIGFAAATLSSPVDPGSGDGSGPGDGPDSSANGDPNIPESSGPGDLNATGQGEQQNGSQWDYCYPPLDGEPIWVPLIAGTLVIGFGTSMLFDRTQAIKVTFIFFWPLLLVVIAATAGCEPPPSQQVVAETINSTTANASQGGGGGERTFTTPTSIIAILFVVAALGVVAAVFLRDDGEEQQISTEPEMDEEEQQAVIGSAAGEAADRIENEAGLENEVYRAWAKMAEPLPVEQPQTSTPADFASAARDAGIEPDDVSELTTLFEEVRYGTATPTEEREERAVEALRRIERHYAENGPADSGDSGGEGSA
jgi:hypothetical protein